jgi:hypothetical protein
MIDEHKSGFRTLAKVIAGITVLGLAGAGLAHATGTQEPIATAAPSSALNGLLPGQWEIRQNMVGGPGGGQNQVRTTCLTQEALNADPMSAFKPEPPAGRPSFPCETAEVKIDAGQISFLTSCELPFGKMKTKWQGIAESERFSVAGQARIMGRALNTQVSGIRLGDCPAS